MKPLAKFLAAVLLLSACTACDRHTTPPVESTHETTVLSEEMTTGIPEATSPPVEATTAPETTTRPDETTVAPETTTTPEVTPQPDETTATPETTARPDETTVAPETTATPEVTPQPDETTATPETTTRPEETTTASPETTKKPAETTKKPAETTKAPEETTTEPEEERPDPIVITVESAGGRVNPQSYYTWEGSAYDENFGAASMLSSVAHSLPILSMSDDLQFVLPTGASIKKLEAYNTSFVKNTRVSGSDPVALGRLTDGLWYILATVTVTEAGQTRGAEFLFSLYVGDEQVLIDDGSAFVFATEIALGGTRYDAATDSMKSDEKAFDLGMLQSKDLPTFTGNEYLSHILFGNMETSALEVYTTYGTPVIISAESLARLAEQLTTGSYYVIISVTWNGDYIESQSAYETKSCVYAIILTMT